MIVVIAVLAAITVVAYNGIQGRAKTAGGQSLAGQISQKVKLFSSVNGRAPTYADLTSPVGTADEVGSQIGNPTTLLDASVPANNPLTAVSADGGKKVLYSTYTEDTQSVCTGSSYALDSFIVYWDYSSNQQVAVPIVSGSNTPTGPVGTGPVVNGTSSIHCPPIVSDRRLKRDIHPLTIEHGLQLYSFKYNWSDTVWVGVMAQDILTTHPEAVSTIPTGRYKGYYQVDYARLGIEFVTLAQWRSTHHQNL